MSVREPLWAWILALACLAGCSAGPRPLQLGPATTAETPADWDDVEAAVAAGASKAQMAVLGCADILPQGEPETDCEPRAEPSARVYHLVTVLDQPAELRIERSPTGSLVLSARVGRFGDPRRERELLAWVSRRLEELHGVETRRVEWLPSDITD